MDYSYWKKQVPGTPLFPDIEWSKPEQKTRAGKLGIIGGNQLGFAGVGEAYAVATETGAGQVRVLLPDKLKTLIPPVITDTVFAPTNQSGSLSRDALEDMRALGQWADAVLLIGDAGRSSETAILYDDFIRDYSGQLILTRDAIDLIKQSTPSLLERPETTFIASFAQVQKLFQNVYYPKVITFSMQLTNLVEALHKFTITYPVTVVTLHKESLVLASNGDVVTHPWDNPMAIWRGSVAARAATYLLWTPSKPLAAIASSL